MIDIDKNLIDIYLKMIEKLGNKSKLELISRLSSSMKTKKKKIDKSVLKLYGTLKSEETAEELIDNIRSSRLFKRKIEGLFKKGVLK